MHSCCFCNCKLQIEMGKQIKNKKDEKSSAKWRRMKAKRNAMMIFIISLRNVFSLSISPLFSCIHSNHPDYFSLLHLKLCTHTHTHSYIFCRINASLCQIDQTECILLQRILLDVLQNVFRCISARSICSLYLCVYVDGCRCCCWCRRRCHHHYHHRRRRLSRCFCHYEAICQLSCRFCLTLE